MPFYDFFISIALIQAALDASGLGFSNTPVGIPYRGMVEPMLEVMAHRGEMRYCLVQRISNEPPVCQVHVHIFQGSAKRMNSINMLNQHNFEQYHLVNTWPAIVLTVQSLHNFVDFLEVDCRDDLPQKVNLRDHLLQTYKFKLSSIFCVLCQHFHLPLLIYPRHEKGLLQNSFAKNNAQKIGPRGKQNHFS